MGLERRINSLIVYWNDRLIELEDLLQPRKRVFGGQRWEAVRQTRLSTHVILLGMMGIFGAVLCWVFIGGLLVLYKNNEPAATSTNILWYWNIYTTQGSE